MPKVPVLSAGTTLLSVCFVLFSSWLLKLPVLFFFTQMCLTKQMSADHNSALWKTDRIEVDGFSHSGKSPTVGLISPCFALSSSHELPCILKGLQGCIYVYVCVCVYIYFYIYLKNHIYMYSYIVIMVIANKCLKMIHWLWVSTISNPHMQKWNCYLFFYVCLCAHDKDWIMNSSGLFEVDTGKLKCLHSCTWISSLWQPRVILGSETDWLV